MTPCRSRPRWVPAYVGLGSNLDQPVRQIEKALDALDEIDHCRLVVASPLYTSPPMGRGDQPDYVNAVAALLTRLEPAALLRGLQAIESAQGRVRDGDRWGPRTLDLDLLVYGTETSSTPKLTLPHPGIAERNFVLLPLQDIAPHLQVPGLGSVSRLVRRLGGGVPSATRLDI